MHVHVHVHVHAYLAGLEEAISTRVERPPDRAEPDVGQLLRGDLEKLADHLDELRVRDQAGAVVVDVAEELEPRLGLVRRDERPLSQVELL